MEKDKAKTSNITLPKDSKESNGENGIVAELSLVGLFESIINVSSKDDLDYIGKYAPLEQKLNELGFYKIEQTNNENRSFYLDIKTTYLKILEINQNSIITKVLINKEERKFQKRRFDIEPFEEMDLKINDIVEITIETSPGKRIFKYTKVSDNTKIKPLFEKQNHFKDLENSELFKPLPIENEDNV